MKLSVLAPSAITAMALMLFAAPMRAQTSTTAAAAATVCADGTTSASTGPGTCSGHGGVNAKATASVHTKVTCKDGMESAGGKGACSHHGGVASKSTTTRTSTMTKKVAKGDDQDSTEATALCKNGMYSHAESHRGACTGHGGVARFLKP